MRFVDPSGYTSTTMEVVYAAIQALLNSPYGGTWSPTGGLVTFGNQYTADVAWKEFERSVGGGNSEDKKNKEVRYLYFSMRNMLLRNKIGISSDKIPDAFLHIQISGNALTGMEIVEISLFNPKIVDYLDNAANGGDGVNLTNEFNQRVSQMKAFFGAIGETYNNMYGGPVLSYPKKFLAFGYIQYKGVGTEFMDPKASRSSSFTKNGGGYVNGEHFSPDDFGNYFYGVAAKAMGLTLLDAVQGAGIYAVFSGTATDWSNWYGLFDERRDTQMIKRGYYGQ